VVTLRRAPPLLLAIGPGTGSVTTIRRQPVGFYSVELAKRGRRASGAVLIAELSMD